jgi:hypothetical protein
LRSMLSIKNSFHNSKKFYRLKYKIIFYKIFPICYFILLTLFSLFIFLWAQILFNFSKSKT